MLLLLLLLPPATVALLLLLPLTGDGLSSFDFRFSGRGGKNAVGDGDGVFEPGLLPLEVLAVVVVLVFVVLVDDDVVVRPPRPLEPPFLNLLCTELRVSVKLLKSLVGCSAALLPRLARPFGVLESSSSVGESQSLWEDNNVCQ